ncbi:hypothetical protein ACIRF8_31010 [Streptomyces sp. NPDC102406]
MRVRRPLLTAIVAGALAVAALGAAGTTTHAAPDGAPHTRCCTAPR